MIVNRRKQLANICMPDWLLQVSGVFSSSPSKLVSPWKPVLTETPGNARPDSIGSAAGTVSEKLNKQAQTHARKASLEPLNNSGRLRKTNTKTPPLHDSSVSSSHAREPVLGKMNLSEDRRVVAGTSTGPSLPVTTPSKAEDFPQSSSLREGIPSNSTNSREARLDKKLHHD